MTEEKIDNEENDYILLINRSLKKIRNSDNYPDYQNFLNTSQKYKLISLFLDPKHRKTVKSAAKNHHQLKKDKMNYLLIEAIINLFIQICKLTDDPLAPWEKDHRMSPGAFKRLIEGRDADYEELVEELEKLKEKNLNGYMLESDHDRLIQNKNEEINICKEQIKKLEMKLDAQEKYYKDKLKARSKRYNDTEQYYNKQFDKMGGEEQPQEPQEPQEDNLEEVYY